MGSQFQETSCFALLFLVPRPDQCVNLDPVWWQFWPKNRHVYPSSFLLLDLLFPSISVWLTWEVCQIFAPPNKRNMTKTFKTCCSLLTLLSPFQMYSRSQIHVIQSTWYFKVIFNSLTQKKVLDNLQSFLNPYYRKKYWIIWSHF